MVPFLCEVVETIMRRLMKIFVRKSVLDEANTAKKLINVKLEQTENLLPITILNLPTATKNALKKSGATEGNKQKFQKGIVTLLKTLIEKLKEKSPLIYPLIWWLKSLSPPFIADRPDAAIIRFRRIPALLYESNLLTAKQSDEANEQYESFVNKLVLMNRHKFKEYDIKSQRLDVFFRDYISNDTNYSSLWTVIKFTMVLSHGQSQVERGFSINAETLSQNMKEETIVSLRLIYDQMLASKSAPHTIEINQKMRINVLASNSRYKQALEEKKKEAADAEKDKAHCIRMENIKKLQKHKENVEHSITILREEADRCYDKAEFQAETSKQMAEVSKGNAIRKKIGEKRKLVSDLNSSIKGLENELEVKKKKQ